MIDYEKAARVLQALGEKSLTLGAVESLTGGLFSATICSIPGASKVFLGAVVTYDPKEKINLIGVKAETIQAHGVVSPEVAKEMAKGGRDKLGVDVCVSFTGNAGPTAEPGSAPVGRVDMCLATKFGFVPMEKDFIGSRNDIREQAVEWMLEQILAVFEN